MNELMNEILINDIPLHFCRYTFQTDEELYKLQYHIAKNAIP